MKNIKRILIFVILFALLFATFPSFGCKPKEKPLNVIIVWHNHQPFYKNPVSGEYILPWVRLHGVKDYYRMPYIVSQYPDVKVTFDLSGSLIAQIRDYLNGAKDEREIISLTPIENLTEMQKWEMLQIPGGFFDINWDHILKKIPMYNSILEQRQQAFKKYGNLPTQEKIDKITSSFSSQYYTNLIALFNLFWMDSEYVKSDPALKPLRDKAFNGENYTKKDIETIMNAQNSVLKKIFPEYKTLLDKKQIEVVTTPYSHPISALLTDFGWNGDLKMQIDKANSVFEKIFDKKPQGVWASECAINDAALKEFANAGWKWTISDADNLGRLGIDTKKNPLAKFVPYNADGVTVFFRDKYLSDGIGFRYSGKSVTDAVNDFANTLLDTEKQNTNGDLVYTIALDGENAWEYYNNDGNNFLNALYKKLSELQKEGKIRMVTPSEYIAKFGKGAEVPKHTVTVLNLKGKDISDITRYSTLPKKEITGEFGESSWVNPTLDTWIGEKQENMAWMMLEEARDKLLSSSITGAAREKAEENLMRAEGSDWFWWYGNDQDSGNDQSFDRLFKMYLFEIYKLINKQPPAYLFGNYFPDGTPYRFVTLNLEKGKYTEVPVLRQDTHIEIAYEGNLLKAKIKGKYPVAVEGIFGGKGVSRPFFLTDEEPAAFRMNPFPYDASDIGIPLNKKIESDQNEITADLSNLNKSNIYIAFAGKDRGALIPYTIPIHVKLPIEIKGTVIGELLDDEGDDNGPGTYVYPLADVFKQAGKGLFDLISFKMTDSGENYVLQYKMANLGGNPWNGPNGISFQIIETYIDFKEGGKTSTIAKGPNVRFDAKHPWDIAIRIAGWSYGNYIEFADGTKFQGELTIRTDQKNNVITVVLPKKYVKFDKNYKPYIAIISGSQDGYGQGYWRKVAVTAGEWQLGGANPDAFNEGISPNVCDLFAPENLSQKAILSSYNLKNKTLATVPMLPLEKVKPVPKLTGKITVKAGKEIKPDDILPVEISISNLGKGVQKDDPASNEFELVIPEEVSIETQSLKSSSGDAKISEGKIIWNGSLPPQGSVTIRFNVKIRSGVRNGEVIPFSAVIFEDSDGDGKDDKKVPVSAKITANYPVELTLTPNSGTFLRNGKKIKMERGKVEFIKEWNDAGAPVEKIVEALGGTYQFDKSKNKITITFMGNKYEHWIGQNKALLNGSAIPLYPNNPEIKSYVENGVPVIPLKSIAYAFKLSYSFDKAKNTILIKYNP